jgi:CO/xanthine dehydrogenase Mo-binding subunit
LSTPDQIASLAADRVTLFQDGMCLGLTADSEFEANRAALRLSDNLNWNAPVLRIDPLDSLNEAPDSHSLATEIGITSSDRLPISTSVTRPCIAHASIGPCCALAIFDENRWQVWSHSQGVFALRDSLAEVLNITPDAVTVRFAPGSGCYGHNGADDVALDAALLARANPGRQVRVIWSREDEFRAAPLGPAMCTTASASLSPDGCIDGFQIEIQSPAHSTRPRGPAAPNLRAAQFLDTPIPLAPALDPPASAGGGSDRNATPLYTFETLRILKCPPPCLGYRPSSFRSLGAQVNVAAIESLMEELSAVTNTDPIEFRLKHLTDPRARHVIQTVCQMADAHPPTNEVIRGLGFARYKNSAAYCAVIAEIEIDADIQVRTLWAAVDAGEQVDPSGLRNQIEGGIVQAISITMGEQVHFGPDGIETRCWGDYPIIEFSQVPQIAISIIDAPTKPPLGVGEVAAGPTTAAILNAASLGLGKRLTRLPLTRDNVTQQLLEQAQ